MKRRFDNIDALRGIAALLVVLQHSLEFSTTLPHTSTLFCQIVKISCIDYCNLGRLGVVSFFLISGFVIPFSFNGNRPLIGFTISRLFRLYPSYWISILLGVSSLSLYTGAHFHLSQILANCTMVQVLFGQHDILGVYWTLTLELFFYSICCLAFIFDRLLTPRHLKNCMIFFTVLAFAAAIAKRLTGHNGIPVGAICLIALMYFGTLTRRAYIDHDEKACTIYLQSLAFIVLTTPLINYIGYAQTTESWIANCTAQYIGMALFGACVFMKFTHGPLTLFPGGFKYEVQR